MTLGIKLTKTTQQMRNGGGSGGGGGGWGEERETKTKSNQLLLSLYHTIPSFNDPEKECF